MSMFINFPEMHAKVQGMEEVPLPEMVTIRESYDTQRIEKIGRATCRERLYYAV